MSNGKNPLMLMMALSMPGAAHALGLGDIHVDSALNERLAAEIEIVGATAADLIDLRAAVASRDTFLRYGADRPAFLSSATFKVSQDAQGRPVLAVRSTEAFSEPMVNFLVDLRWHSGEVVRQYTLLLDPPGFAAANKAAEVNRIAETALPASPTGPAAPDLPAAPAAATPLGETKTQTVARQIDPPTVEPKPAGIDRGARKMTHVKVGAKATLRGVAWRVGERSESDIQRMMLAIFRANPGAFDGNINRLHLGAVLTIPSREQAAAIPRSEARREVHAQMLAWREPARATPAGTVTAAATSAASTTSPVSPRIEAASIVAAAAAAATSAAPTAAPAPAAASAEALDNRVQLLEHELVEVKSLLESQNDKLAVMSRQAAHAETAEAENAPAEQSPTAADAASDDKAVGAIDTASLPQPKSGHAALGPIAGGIGLLGAALAALYVGMRRRARKLKDSIGAEPQIAAVGADHKNVVEPLDSGRGTAAKQETAEAHDSSRTGAFADAFTPIYGEAAPEAPHSIAASTPAASAPAAPLLDDDTQPLLPVVGSPLLKRINNAAATISPPDAGETTVNQRADTVNMQVHAQRLDVTRVDATHLDYNLLDLDMTAQHVHMPSVLNEHVVVKERRTNLADVLKLAIEREPDRHDLRMKLLELYYSAAATNRQAFLEAVQKFARDRSHMQPEEWDKIAFMGRQIASENPLFAPEPEADDALADCA